MTDTISRPATISHWIGGQLVPGTSGRTSPVFNPATGAVQADLQLASVEELDRAVAVARRRSPRGARRPCRSARTSCSASGRCWTRGAMSWRAS